MPFPSELPSRQWTNQTGVSIKYSCKCIKNIIFKKISTCCQFLKRHTNFSICYLFKRLISKTNFSMLTCLTSKRNINFTFFAPGSFKFRLWILNKLRLKIFKCSSIYKPAFKTTILLLYWQTKIEKFHHDY